MATWPANGNTDWNTKMLAWLAVSFEVDGTPKASAFASIFGLSAYTNEDSDGNAMLKAHAYKAVTDGYVTANVDLTTAGHRIRGYVGLTNDPAGAGNRIRNTQIGGATYEVSISFLVAKDEYFEITSDSGAPTIWWKSIGTLSEPIDQD